MNEKLRINVFINGFTTSLNIKPEQEEIYRAANKLLNERIDKYVKRYHNPNKEYTDILNMVAYELAVEYLKLHGTKEAEPQQQINEIARLLNGIDLDDE